MTFTSYFDSRDELRRTFLAREGWDFSALLPVGEDMAMRRYFRIRREEKSVILMESLPDNHPQATPGHRVRDFLRLSQWLRTHGLHAPGIYAVDEENGYVLLEDMGDENFRQAIDSGKNPDILYGAATDVLARLAQIKPDIDLPKYIDSHVHKGRRRVVDWYIPAVHERKNPDGMVEEYLRVWDAIEKKLPPCPEGFMHVDFHLENLMWNSELSGTDRCGILDFQGAMIGPLPYDLANLLEDGRLLVPAGIRKRMLDHYCESIKDPDVFRAWYRVLATQFHCRLIGQFIKLPLVAGKTKYLKFLPVLADYLREGLKDPLLAPLEEWFIEQGIDFTVIPLIGEGTRSLIRQDAF